MNQLDHFNKINDLAFITSFLSFASVNMLDYI